MSGVFSPPHTRSGKGYARQALLASPHFKRRNMQLVDPKWVDHPGVSQRAALARLDQFRYQADRGVPRVADAVDAAVARYIRGSGTRGLRKQTMTISSLPKMVSQSGGFIVKHRECIGVVTTNANAGYQAIVNIGNANMATTGLRLYPTNGDAFPWLSTIAVRFEQYRWRKVNVQYITASSDGTTQDLSQGNIMAYMEYNPTTVNKPLTSRDFLNNYGACAVKPSQSFQMGVEARGNPFELKWTATAGAQDPRFSADAALYVATEGVAVGQAIGYLYMDYEIELHKPQVSSP